jgi:hypothetical protein
VALMRLSPCYCLWRRRQEGRGLVCRACCALPSLPPPPVCNVECLRGSPLDHNVQRPRPTAALAAARPKTEEPSVEPWSNPGQTLVRPWPNAPRARGHPHQNLTRR